MPNKNYYLTLLLLFSLIHQLIADHSKLPLSNDEKVYISTDRYLYEAGEFMLYSAFIHRYHEEWHSNRLKVWLEDTKGKVLDSVFQIVPQKKKIQGSIKLPRKGGMYLLKAQSYRQNSFAKPSIFTKEIFVQSYHAQSVSLRVETNKKNYLPQQEVKGFIKCLMPGGLEIKQQKIIGRLMQDGKVIQEKILHTNIDGKANFQFQLPIFDIKSNTHFYVVGQTQYRGNTFSVSNKLVTKEKEVLVEAFFEHGNLGYIEGISNKVVLKSTDKHSNPYDISASLVDSRNKKIATFQSYKNGLGSFEFTPKASESYRIVRNGKTLLYLGKAQEAFGIQVKKLSQFLQASIAGRNGGALLELKATFNNKVIYEDYLTTSGFANIPTKGQTGVVSIQIKYQGQIIARRLYFVGRARIKPLGSNIKRHVFLKDSLDYLKFSHPKGLQSRMSVSLVKESNINQMKNKSHDAVSWLYLGSEFNTEIDEPQYYFDKTMPKSGKTLALLMNTLNQHWIKDFNTGKVIMQHGHQELGEIVITGRLYHYNAWGRQLKIKNATVSVINSSFSTNTDQHGHFKLILPENYKESYVRLIATRDSLKSYTSYFTFYHLLDPQKDFKSRSIPSEMLSGSIPIPAIQPGNNNAVTDNNTGLRYRRNTLAAPIFSATMVTGASRSPGAIIAGTAGSGLARESMAPDIAGTVAGVNRTANGSLSFVGSRPDATAVYVDGVRVKAIRCLTLRSMGNSSLYRDFSGTSFNMGSTQSGAGVGTISYTGMPFYSNTTYTSTNVPRYYDTERLNLHVYRTYRRKRYRNPYVPRSNRKFTAFWKSFVASNLEGKISLPIKGIIPAGAFYLLAEGIDELGKPVFFKKRIEVRDRFDVQCHAPKYLYNGDKAQIKLDITNYCKQAKELKLYVNHNNSYPYYKSEQYILDSDSSLSIQVPITAQEKTNFVTISLTNQSRIIFKKNFKIPVLSKTEPEKLIFSGDSSRTAQFDLANAIKGSTTFKMRVFHSMNEQITQMAERLVRQPHGCFEQVSSANYPNIIALQNMYSRKDFSSSSVQRTRSFINRGYRKLVGYETPQKGFEWYGRNPPHQALTAYGLLQFHLMKELNMSVDHRMFRRNLEWLWSQRDGKGGFKFTKGKYGFSGANYNVNNAYITYVLSRISNYNLAIEMERIEKRISAQFDAYQMALFANACFKTGDSTKSLEYLQQLHQHFIDKSYTKLEAKRSFVYSYGKSLDLEILGLTLQLATHLQAWDMALPIRAKILESVNSRGYFGNTQATALCLEGLNEFTKYYHQMKWSTQLKLYVNNKLILNKDMSQVNGYLDLPVEAFKDGINQIKVESNGKSLPYQLEIKYAPKEQSKSHPSLVLSSYLPKYTVKKGDQIPLTILMENNTDRVMGQVVASVGIPACFTLPTEELRQAVKLGEIDYYEIHGDELHLYILGLMPRQKKSLSFNLRADIRGKFGFKAMDLMEYYQPEVFSRVIIPDVTVN
jgi:hypothetical protein